VAKSASGKWVSRVGATGGGKAYKKSRPGNYYGALAVIVVLGLTSTLFARYEYQNPTKATKGTAPIIGTTWYAALSVEACGTTLPYLNADPTYKGGFTVQAADVVKISPVSAADSGNNATLSQFALEYPGLTASSSQLAIPTATGLANPKTSYKNGDVCPSSSKYTGQKGQVSYAYWSSFGQKKPTITTNPASIKFVKYMRITMAFEPKGVTPRAPRQATINAMVQLGQAGTTTTTAPTAPTTTVPAKTGGSTTTSTTTTTAPKG
jgi:hypothetical protein